MVSAYRIGFAGSSVVVRAAEREGGHYCRYPRLGLSGSIGRLRRRGLRALPLPLLRPVPRGRDSALQSSALLPLPSGPQAGIAITTWAPNSRVEVRGLYSGGGMAIQH